MAQQVMLGTIRSWDEIGEKIEIDRKVVLQKVYRNTKNILNYIQNLGYEIEIPQGIKEGKDVEEHLCENVYDEIKIISKNINENEFDSVGIIAKEEQYLLEFKKTFGGEDKIHVMTMNEAQGVEFDAVFIVGLHENTFSVNFDDYGSLELLAEKKRINNDLLYVALTRAISQLHVFGKIKLSNLMLRK
jgi:superfamily I DNA/RNA helicase